MIDQLAHSWKARLASSPALVRALVVAVSLLSLPACDSQADAVCQDIGNCSRGGDDEWVSACQSQAKDLRDEAKNSGCGAAYDSYFSCAEEHFECEGNRSLFRGCESKRGALESCLEQHELGNACGQLRSKLQACPGADAGADAGGSADPDAGTPLPACTTGGACSARCYLDHVADVCAPIPAELTAFAGCADSCVF
jgi:hypothetical protein